MTDRNCQRSKSLPIPANTECAPISSQQTSEMQRRKRSGQPSAHWMAACLVFLALLDVSSAFSLLPRHNTKAVGHNTLLHVSHDLQNSWSSAGNSSRLGVRKRVRAVLAKARSRSSKGTSPQAVSTSYYPNTKPTLVIPQTPRTPDRFSPDTVPMRKNSNTPDLFLFKDESNTDEPAERILTAADEPEAHVEEAVQDVPLPFVLPSLSPIQKQLLSNGERIQEQSKMGREGSGFVVLDVDAPDYVVWDCLLDFEKYPESIGTVRSMQLYDVTERPTEYDVQPPAQRPSSRYGKGLETRASFILSKFRLNIAAVHTYQPHPAGHFMEFSLDKSCRNAVLKHAKGIWHTESNPDGKEGVTRVWLLCELQVSSVLPSFIVDYTAKKAMPRASNWIRPTVEARKREMNIP